jgi:hypothetical protein
MIPAGARVFVSTKPVDFRKGPASLMALVEGMDWKRVKAANERRPVAIG